MGCINSTPSSGDEPIPGKDNGLAQDAVQFGAPAPWKSEQPLTQAQLDRQREEFWGTWGTAVYGGDVEIWAALRAAVESDTETARAIIDSAGIIVSGRDLSTCWDSRGALYSLPKYVLSAPTNLVKE